SNVDRPYVGETDAGSAAAKAGFQVEDEVLKVGDAAVTSWNDFRLEILSQGLNGGDVPVTVLDAEGQEQTRILDLGDQHLLEDEGDIFDSIGFNQWWPVLPAEIGGVLEKSAAENAGVQQGDIIVRVDGVEISQWRSLVEIIRQKPGTAMQFVILRDANEKTITVIPQSRETEEGEQQGYIGAYQHIPESVRQQLVVHLEYSPLQAAAKALIKTWDTSSLTLRVLWKMVVGEANLANISGPITIATYAGATASIGLVSFLSFLAVISVSLGVLNLLPVPMLDGGHLFYYLIEIIKGSPVSEASEMLGQKVGIVLLALLMSIAIFNDIQRLVQ
ncbi:MAG: RIP metalloprotease RseP, partial [Gammaproteobacteria bacterium]|nr:RIP metalloprotease RseP [Gammaproteobacteria bacterium]